MTAIDPGPEEVAGGPGRLFWPAAVAGWGLVVAGVWGLLAEAPATRPAEVARYVVGGAMAHDLLLAPGVVLAGWVVARAVPARVRGPLQAALVASALIALFAFPFVRGYGRVSTNPSILPRDYGTGLILILGAVWGVAALALARRRLSRARTRRRG
ncbi:MAG: hypothetical protein ACRD0N_05270 [Acidimicrobiales bacterium]